MIEVKDLTPEQKTAFDHILKFLKSSERQMVLTGYAGTGKTTLLSVLLDHIEDHTYKNVICTAPTNEAVRVISKLTNRKFFQTIYSILGLALIEVDDTDPVLKPTSRSKMDEFDIIFIDEASMIQSDLFNLIQEELTQCSRIKIIYIGDSAQLPPVKDEGRDSRVFDLENQVKLVEVQRTAKKNPIIKIVTQMRNNLSATADVFERQTVLNEDGDMGVVFHDNRDEYLQLMFDDFKSEEYKNDSNHVKVLAYTNKTVNALNKRIRKKIFERDDLPEFVVNDMLVVDKPILTEDGAIEFTVGERLRVLGANLQEDEETRMKYWTLTIINYEEPPQRRLTRRIKVVDKMCVPIYRRTLAGHANEAKLLMNKARYDKGFRISKREAWKNYFRYKNQFAWVKYQYAMTTHKSQGGTFTNVYVINADCNKLTWNHVERNKLKYVAFTRTSNLLRII